MKNTKRTKENVTKFFAKITPLFFKKVRKKIIQKLDNVRFKYTYDCIPGEMLRGELNWLFETAQQMGSIVEVGSWKGRSTHALLSGCRGTVHAVDHFLGCETAAGKCTRENAVLENVFQEFQKNVGYLKNLKIHKMSSIEAAKNFEDKSIDMIFIDADHSYESLKADIEAWLPKVKRLICGHDYSESTPGVERAVREKFDQVKTIHSIWFRYL